MISALRASIVLAIAGAATLAPPAGAEAPLAADFPGRPVTFVVPGPVGGVTDTLCRMVADKLRQSFGRPVVVENRPGAVGSIGASAVASAQPTGHTLLCTPDAPIVLSPLINRGLPYGPDAFEPVVSLAATYSIVAVRRDFPAVSIDELIAYAKANPKRLNCATGGNGSNSHIATAWFARAAAVEMVNIPYQGSAPSLRALLGGEVDLLIDSRNARGADACPGRIRGHGVPELVRDFRTETDAERGRRQAQSRRQRRLGVARGARRRRCHGASIRGRHAAGVQGSHCPRPQAEGPSVDWRRRASLTWPAGQVTYSGRVNPWKCTRSATSWLRRAP
jgi:Tripartite tricarboxylate transporter family receptor